MSLNTDDAKEHKRDIGLFRDFVKINGCASNSVLVDQRAEMIAVLRSMEWSGSHTDYEDSWGVMTRACPFCFNAKDDGHKPTCKLVEMIKALT